MKLETIHDLWATDSVIDESALDAESLKIPQITSKYLKQFSIERMRLRQMEGEHKRLELEKREFYTQGPTEEQHKKGWALPARGKISTGMVLKDDVKAYLEGDEHLIKSLLEIAYQQEKVDLLTKIVDSLNKRSFHIKNAIEFLRWTQGG